MNQHRGACIEREGGQFLPEQTVNIGSLSFLLARLPVSVEPVGQQTLGLSSYWSGTTDGGPPGT